MQASLLSPAAPLANLGIANDGAPGEVTREAFGSHVLAEISRCCGPQLPRYDTEQILDGFWERFGARGMTVCEQVFGVHNGMWRGAPVTILRFQATHDPYFALPLLDEAAKTRAQE